MRIETQAEPRQQRTECALILFGPACFIYKMWLTLSCLSEGKAHPDELLRSLLEPLEICEICDFMELILILPLNSCVARGGLFLSLRPHAPHLQNENFFFPKWIQKNIHAHTNCQTLFLYENNAMGQTLRFLLCR